MKAWYTYTFKYEMSRRYEKLLVWISHRLPRKVAYWAAIRVGVNATTGPYSSQVVPDLLFMDVLKRWSK